jgi:transcriptional regulator with XRE-family HTH domain
VRALAARASVSPAYVTAIETGNNPSTGRPPTPSLAIAQRLAAALEVDVATLLRGAEPPASHGEHVLAYVLAEPAGGIVAALDAQYGDAVDHWLHLADPRGRDGDPDGRATTRRFTFGEPPYATPDLDPDALLQAVDREVAALAPAHHGARVGLVIADCSAVMRYLRDASTEVALEATWHGAVTEIWQTRLGAAPAVDVCAYRHDDIAALGLTIDGLATALDLVGRHDEVLLLDGAETVRGAPAIRRILAGARPPGASSAAWEQLAAAAASTLAAGPVR